MGVLCNAMSLDVSRGASCLIRWPVKPMPACPQVDVMSQELASGRAVREE